MPPAKLHVQLMQYTPNPVQAVAMSARICYSASTIDDLQDRTNSKDQTAFIRKIQKSGHLTPFEHVSFTFGIEGVSRSMLAQITRHRIASFSVQSQRYVTSKSFEYILPPRIEALGEEAIQRFDEQMQTMHDWYQEWLQVLGEENKEDARFVLPNAAQTRMVMTMNARELLHFFSLRCCMRAQWEINTLAWEMLRLVKAVAPALFETAGPSCVAGPCTEGSFSCGRMHEMQEKACQIGEKDPS